MSGTNCLSKTEKNMDDNDQEILSTTKGKVIKQIFIRNEFSALQFTDDTLVLFGADTMGQMWAENFESMDELKSKYSYAHSVLGC